MSGMDWAVRLVTHDGEPAQGAQGAASGGGLSGWVTPILLMAVIGGIMYFIVLRPQQQEKKKLEALLAGLTRDDRVITTSGIHGRIVSVTPTTVEIEIAERTRITVEKASIARKVDAEAPAMGEKPAEKKG